MLGWDIHMVLRTTVWIKFEILSTKMWGKSNSILKSHTQTHKKFNNSFGPIKTSLNTYNRHTSTRHSVRTNLNCVIFTTTKYIYKNHCQLEFFVPNNERITENHINFINNYYFLFRTLNRKKNRLNQEKKERTNNIIEHVLYTHHKCEKLLINWLQCCIKS